MISELFLSVGREVVFVVLPLGSLLRRHLASGPVINETSYEPSSTARKQASPGMRDRSRSSSSFKISHYAMASHLDHMSSGVGVGE